MSQFLVAVVNGTKARFLTLEPAEFPEYESGPNLVEHEGLFNFTNELQGQELWANSKTGRNRGSSGQAHTYDDHRDSHVVEFERRFAHGIATKLFELAQVHQVSQLVLAAEPQILGLMREVLLPTLPKQFKLNELAKDLCQLKPNELHDYLADKGFLPPHQKASTAM
jgi:protein required for attachment to host cells